MARVVPWRPMLLTVLAVATVPALGLGLILAGDALLAEAGSPRWSRTAIAVPLVAAPLAVVMLLLAVTSLRARGRHRRALREEACRTNGRLASFIGATDDAILLLDREGRVRNLNPAAERLYGMQAAEVLGREFESLMERRDRSVARDALMVVVAADRRVTTEGRHRRDGGTFPAMATWTAIRDAAGGVEGVSVLVRDATAPSLVAGAPRAAAESRATSAPTTSTPYGPAAGVQAIEAPCNADADADRRVRLLTDAALDAIVGTDDAGHIVGWNPAAARLFGIDEDEARGRPLGDLLVTPDPSPGHDAADWRTCAGSTAIVHARRDDGSTFPAELTVTAYEDQQRTWFTAFLRDVTARLAAETRAKEHESRYRALVEHLPGVVYRCPVGRWAPATYISPRLEALLGFRPEEWVGVAGVWEEHIHPADLQRVLASDDLEANAAAGSVQNEDREYRMLTRDGREVWVRDHADLERDADGNAVAWNGFLTDVTERKRLEAELTRLAFRDPLTGLANRALLNDRIAHAIARRTREAGTIAMLVVDLDDFKLVNDAHGHEAGDRLLVAAAERLRECVRADATIARLGGDEFAILLEGLSDDGAALVVAQRMVRAFDKPLRMEGATIPSRVSVGVAVDVTGQRSAAWLLRSADTAMYEAKRLGKGRWQAYDPAAHLASAKRLVLESELRRAMERRQFVLAYQPVTDLRTGDIVGTEALIRWNHPTRGVVGPVEFISVLESTGLIEPVGRWVVDEACRQAAVWEHQLPALRWTAVNVSAAQLRSDAFTVCVRDALAAHGLSPDRLTLEVTESLALDDSIATADRLHDLRALGCGIAIDDFGTGYSSLAYLRRLPIDRLKIDRTFVDGLGSDPEAMAVARAIVDLATSLKLSTVAEGIEQPHQAEALIELGCQLGQGYLFAKPLRAADLTALVLGRQAAAAMQRGAPEALAS